jgi:hyaluronoglucosaminidase
MVRNEPAFPRFSLFRLLKPVFPLLVLLLGCRTESNATCAPPTSAYAKPRFLAATGSPVSVAHPCISAGPPISALWPEMLAENGFARDNAGCDWSIRLSDMQPSLDGDALAAWTAGSSSPERFAAVTTADHGAVNTIIYAASAGPMALALRTLLSQAANHQLTAGQLVDYPTFPLRGLVESIYGKQYSIDERTTMIRLMGYLRQNIYVYGQKDTDPYTHDRWREPYDQQKGVEIASAAAEAKRNLITFVWSISPGLWPGGSAPLSIEYSSDQDFNALTAKLQAVRRLGVDHFALLLDDLDPAFGYASDRAQFQSLADAHAHLVKRLDDWLNANGLGPLMFVGKKYNSDPNDGISGGDWMAYMTTLQQSLPPDVQVFWTGPGTWSRTISAADLSAVDQVLQRKVVVWDNWPLEVAPLAGRTADVSTAAAGLLSCPVLNEERRKPTGDFWKVLGSIAAYTWNPDVYDANASMQSWAPLLPCLLPVVE